MLLLLYIAPGDEGKVLAFVNNIVFMVNLRKCANIERGSGE